MITNTEQLFTEARSQNGYLGSPVPAATLRALYDLLKWGPTSANSSPARFAFVASTEAKARLADCMSPGNRHKVLQAPVSVIIKPRNKIPRNGNPSKRQPRKVGSMISRIMVSVCSFDKRFASEIVPIPPVFAPSSFS